MQLRERLMHAATDADTGGGSPASTPEAPPPPPPPPATTPPPAAGPSAMKGGGRNALKEANADPDPLSWLPEKHRVLKDDGTLDVEASARKNAEAYQALEKRLGAGGVPPPSPGEYDIKPPDELKDAFDPADPGFKQLLTKAHGAGVTQAQMGVFMDAFWEWAPKIIGESQQLAAEECTAQLEKVWTTPEERKAGFRDALRALETFGGERVQTLEKKYGNDPDVVWLLANIGKELKEDRSPSGAMAPGAGGESSASLMAHPAFEDAKHPQHAEISARWKAAVARETKAKQ